MLFITNFSRKSVKFNKLKENISVFTKLFLVMGILWVFEILSLHVHNPLFSLVFGILNISRGSFMFIIFILKTSVLNGLNKLFQSKPIPEENISHNSSRWRSRARGRTYEASVCDTELWGSGISCVHVIVSLIKDCLLYKTRNIKRLNTLADMIYWEKWWDFWKPFDNKIQYHT